MAHITKIVFDGKGRPHWFPVTDAFMHRLSDYEKLQTVDFSESEKEWFRRPLSAERSEWPQTRGLPSLVGP